MNDYTLDDTVRWTMLGISTSILRESKTLVFILSCVSRCDTSLTLSPCHFTSTEDFYGAPTSALRQQRQIAESAAQTNLSIPLFHKQAIIVLREELEYFAIPINTPLQASSAPLSDITNQQPLLPATDEHGNANPPLMHIKAECGKQLLSRRSIFTALQRNVNRENNMAEQHLIDMLCMR